MCPTQAVARVLAHKWLSTQMPAAWPCPVTGQSRPHCTSCCKPQCSHAAKAMPHWRHAMPAGPAHHRRRRLQPPAAGALDEPQPDIDLLAQMLSQQAAKMRASMDAGDQLLHEPEPTPSAPAASGTGGKDVGPFGFQGAEAEERLLAEVGDGGMLPDDFELLQELGRLSVQQVSTSGSSESGMAQYTAVVAYAARYTSGLPYQPPVNVLIKEYLPRARCTACNELLLLKRLCGLPEHKWQVGTAERTADPPVVQLLGYFSYTPSLEASILEASNADVSAEVGTDSLWLVYKWEGMRPLALYLQSGPPRPLRGIIQGLFMSREAASATAYAARRSMLRAIARGVLGALAYCHERGVVHGSLSAGSVLLSAMDDGSADELVVKLDGFGFGRLYGGSGDASSSDTPLASISPQLLSPSATTSTDSDTDADAAQRRKADLQAAALLLMELFMVGLAPGDEQGQSVAVMDAAGLQRMLFDVFHESIEQFRDYCTHDEVYASFVEFMDANSRAGWQLLGSLVEGEQAASELLHSDFFTAADAPK